ncbi:MAG: ATP-binding protein, partial [Candidatus Symbiothrix sp.]|nr:ATP-binding protein [Candidatus Symbiothrix sp.]
MIVEFTVGNFLSFNEKRTLSFEARGGVSELKDNFFAFEKQRFLRSIVLYGANSSGKSNLIKALSRMKSCVMSSVKLNETDELNYTPFLLSSVSENQPTFFEMVFVSKKQQFRYGFEYIATEIINEWLFEIKKTKEIPFFVRTNKEIAVSDNFQEGKGKEEATNNNRLFISLVAQLGGAISKQILEWFSNCNVISGMDHMKYMDYTMKMFYKQSLGYSESLQLFQDLKLGFKNVEVIESEFNSEKHFLKGVSEEIKAEFIKKFSGRQRIELKIVHNKYDDKGEINDTISWYKDENESEGTRKIIDLSGPLFDTLLKGKILIVDELDAKLHPLITMHIIKQFNNPETNPNNAQLLFATHDTNLLSTDIFRRDQVWFTEKDTVEQTDLYSLDDFVFTDGTKVRKDANLEKNY